MVASVLPMLYQWSMTSVDAGRDTAKQRRVRASLVELIVMVDATWKYPCSRPHVLCKNEMSASASGEVHSAAPGMYPMIRPERAINI